MVFGFNFGVNLSESVNRTIQNYKDSLNDSTKSEISNIAKSDVEITFENKGGKVECGSGGLNIKVENKVELETIQMIKSNTDKNFGADVFSKLEAAAESAAKQEQEGLVIADVNVAVNASRALNEKKTEIINEINKTVNSIQINQTDTSTKIHIINSEGGSILSDGCTITANSLVNSISKNVAGLFVKEDTNISEKTDSSAKSRAKSDQTLKGIPGWVIAIIAVVFILGGGGAATGAAAGGTGKMIVGAILFILGISTIIASFFIDSRRCKDGEDPENSDKCLDEDKDKDTRPDCKCKDKSKYENRRWSYWLFLLVFISGCVFTLLGLIYFFYGYLSRKSTTPRTGQIQTMPARQSRPSVSNQ